MADAPTALSIRPADFADERVVALLRTHTETARAQTEPGSAHALDLDALQTPSITVWTAWEGDSLVGVGALKQLSPDHGEIKSMHTAAGGRRRGVGSAMLRHLIDTARLHGLTRLSLETGSWDYFHPARSLYGKHGFAECPPFADYVLDPASVFMTRELGPGPARA